MRCVLKGIGKQRSATYPCRYAHAYKKYGAKGNIPRLGGKSIRGKKRHKDKETGACYTRQSKERGDMYGDLFADCIGSNQQSAGKSAYKQSAVAESCALRPYGEQDCRNEPKHNANCKRYAPLPRKGVAKRRKGVYAYGDEYKINCYQQERLPHFFTFHMKIIARFGEEVKLMLTKRRAYCIIKERGSIMVKYSIVVPTYNEEKSLQIFHAAVTKEFDTLGEEYEIIFVNDGSTDGTQSVLDGLCALDKRVKVCRFSRNFGQQPAILCGMDNAKGEAVLVMDADLQDPPAVALKMIEKWKEGYELVHGRREKRHGESAFKKNTAKLFYGFTRKITGLDIPSSVGDFKLYDRKVVNAVLSLSEHDRLLRAQTAWLGFKQAFVDFERPQRVAGKTHYTVKKMCKLAQAGIFPNTDYTLTLPLKSGIALLVLSVVCMVVFIALSCAGVSFGGLIAWIFPAIGVATGAVLLCQGLTNIHIAMIYREAQNRPKYIVSEKKNFVE